MSELNGNIAGAYGSGYTRQPEQVKGQETQKAQKKTNVGGRTIGNPVLSEKAQKYYEQLKAKFSNMEFILVSPDKKEEAERNKGMYQSSRELLVLIDSDKIEKMAEDESYRLKYEGILSMATAQMEQMKTSLGANAERVSSFGMTFDDYGNASFFAVVDKSLEAQKERIEEKRQQNRKERRESAKEEAEKRLEERRENVPGKADKHDGVSAGNRVTVTAPSWEELLKKIEEIAFADRADSVMTEAEKSLGQNLDYSV